MAVEPSRGIVIVADGMGGAPAGEVASALAVQEVCRGFHEGQGMRDAVLRANGKIQNLAAEQASFAGMGTTLTALRVRADTGAFEIGHVGDSRAYRLTGNQLWQITRDHTVVAEMVEAGTLAPSSARGHHLGHILSQALGTQDDPDVEVVLGQAEAGDRFLVCSDGLTRVLEDHDLEECLLRSREVDLEDVIRGAVEEANRRGAPDNVTMAILAVDALD
jgi:protein phosphatase